MWNPEPAVTINGVDYTGETLNNIGLTFGAPDFLAGVQPPYGTITLVNTTGSALPIYLSNQIAVTVWNSQKTIRRNLFTGIISDISVSLVTNGVAFYDLTVVGNSQFFESRIINDIGYPEQSVTVRAAELIQAGTGTPIDLLSGTIDNQTGTIDQFPNYLGTVSVPSGTVITVVPSPGEPKPAGKMIASFAAETSGWLWEDRLGKINYRPFDGLSTTSFTVPESCAVVQGLQKTSTLTELYNQIIIYLNPNDLYQLSPSRTRTDTTSATAYGLRELGLTTQYYHGPGSPVRWDEQGDYLLSYLANNINQLNGLTADLTVDALTDAQRNALIEVDMTQICNFDVPSDIFPTNTGSGRVCGWSWTIQQFTLELTLNLVKVA